MLETPTRSKRKAVNAADASSERCKSARLQEQAGMEGLPRFPGLSVGLSESAVDVTPDEAVEALLRLHEHPWPRESSAHGHRHDENEPLQASRSSSPECNALTRRLRATKNAGLASKGKSKRRRGSTPVTAKQGELPKRCSCGKHISKDHPLCKSNVKELLERFLDKYCRGTAKGSIVDLQQAEIEFDVALRRLYDILVVLEAAQVLLRVSSKKYEVLGMNDMPSLLSWLDKYQEQRAVSFKTGVRDEKVAGREQGGSYDLSCMLMIHLREQKKPVVLSDAAEVLKGLSPKAKACKKTIERRIYDIGSVLETLNLIKRSYQPPNKQPSFEWNAEYVHAHMETEQSVSEERTEATCKADGADSTPSPTIPAMSLPPGPLDSPSRPLTPSAFSNWCPMGPREGPESPEDLLRRYSSDQMSDWSHQTSFRRPSPPRSWPTAAMSAFAPLADLHSFSSLSSSLPLPSMTMSTSTSPGMLGAPSCGLGTFGTLPDGFASLSIPPLDLPPLNFAERLLARRSLQEPFGSSRLGLKLCKPQAVRATSQPAPTCAEGQK